MQGLRGNGEWSRYLRRNNDENSQHYAETLWEEAERLHRKGDYERGFVALTNAAFNGHEEAAATLVEVWGMLLRKEVFDERYANYKFLREDLSSQEVQRAYDYYLFIHETILMRKSGVDGNVLEFRKKEEF